jgi:hypothetical protein
VAHTLLPDTIKLGLTSRHGFVAPYDHVLISCDFSGQETLVAAALSEDPVMTNSFKVEPFILPDGSTTRTPPEGVAAHENPEGDLHTLSTRAFCFPHLFEGKSKYDWVTIARNGDLIPMPGTPRDFGKRVNYFIQYLGSAASLADLCHVEKEIAEGWIKGHQQLYEVFHRWAQDVSALGAARGWIETSWAGRVRWIDEENAKKAGESPGRAAVNHLIQGLCADMGKLAMIAVLKRIEHTPIQLCNFVHDELLVLAPGQAILESAKEKNGITKLKYVPDDQARETAEMIKEIMERVETIMVKEYLPGSASFEVAPFWSH